jgi:hypothetical protein
MSLLSSERPFNARATEDIMLKASNENVAMKPTSARALARSANKTAVVSNAPLVLATSIGFGGVVPGSGGPDISVDPSFGPPGISFAGGVTIKSAPSTTTVRADIADNVANAFAVRDLFVLDWQLEDVDPGELPPGHHGRPPKVRVLEVQETVPGTGSISVKEGQMLLVRVQYTAPVGDVAATATLNIRGDGWPVQQVALSLFTAEVVTTLGLPSLTLFQGQIARLPLLVKSLAGPPVDVRYEASPLQRSTGVSIPTSTVHLDRGGFTTTPLALVAAPDAPLGENTLFVNQFAFQRKGLVIPVRIEPVPQQVLADAARQKIIEKYNALGGSASGLGLPVDPSMPLTANGATFAMDFRGGSIHIDDTKCINDPNCQPTATVTDTITVKWVALECQIRQEATDEMYGGVSILTPGIKLAGIAPHQTVKFPDEGDGTIDLGPDGLRIFQTARELYSGPPTDLVIGCHLIEHDSGDVGEVKQAVREAIDKVADSLGPLTGVDAEHLASQQDFLGRMSQTVLDGISNFLGASDDPYNPGAVTLFWQDLKARNAPRQVLTRSDDPRKVNYTHSLIVSGKDDGGDVGQYAFYFDVT